MDTLADRLQYLDIHSRSTAVVTIILELLVSGEAVGSFLCCQRECGSPSDARDDGAGVEREYGGVGVNVVWVEDFGEINGWEDGVGQAIGERVLVWTIMKSMRPQGSQRY